MVDVPKTGSITFAAGFFDDDKRQAVLRSLKRALSLVVEDLDEHEDHAELYEVDAEEMNGRLEAVVAELAGDELYDPIMF